MFRGYQILFFYPKLLYKSLHQSFFYSFIRERPFSLKGAGYGFFLKKIFWFPMLSYNLMLNSGKKIHALHDKKKYSNSLCFPKKKILNEKKNHNLPLQVKWSVPNHLTLRKWCYTPLQHNFVLDPMISSFHFHFDFFSNICHVTSRKLRLPQCIMGDDLHINKQTNIFIANHRHLLRQNN
jgi:hypothetical protein